MTRRSVVHATFCLERVLDARPARVFAALSTLEGKAAWFSAPPDDWELIERAFDFRVGGRERLAGRWSSGTVTDFQATYHGIVENERIVYAYDMWRDGAMLSVSLATYELKPEGQGTRLVLTE